MTLLELVVTLALFAIVMLGVVAAWEKAQEAYFVAADAAEVQQNLRTALDLMASEIRSAGRDATICAFDYAGAASLDCTIEKASGCRAKLGAGYPAGGCRQVFAIPFAEATATTLRLRSDRNANGTVGIAANGDAAEEDVRYALASGSPPCPPGVGSCITRDGGAGPVALVAVDISGLRFTYFPRRGYPPCDGSPAPQTCPAFAALLSQLDADNVGRIRIGIQSVTTVAGTPVARRLETDVNLAARN